MRNHLAWLDVKGHYVHATEEYIGLFGSDVCIKGTALADLHAVAVADVLTTLLNEAVMQGVAETSLRLFDEHTLYNARIIYPPMADHAVLAVERCAEQPHLYAQFLTGNATDQVPRFKSALNAYIRSAVKSGRQVGLLKIHIERFSWIQENLGETNHDILEEIAVRLLGTLREDDTLLRAGDDEFIVQLARIESEESVLAVAHRLVEQLSYGVRYQRREVHLSASIGVALAPLQASDAAELLGAAEQALKAQLRSGISGVRLYDPIRQRKALHLKDLAELIKPDVQNLDMGFRPIYGVHSHRIEAAQLIPLVKGVPCVGEEEYLLTQILDGAAGWHTYLGLIFNQLEAPLQTLSQQKGFEGVIVRIPPDVLELPSFMEFMTTRLHLCELVRNLVLLEVDAIETRDHEGVLFDLEALGFRIVLNGLSDYLPPLQQLKELEPQLIKLDQGLVHDMSLDPKRRKLLEKVADMASDLEIPLAADGVMSAGQRLQLAQQGVDFMQGEYFGNLLSVELLYEQLIMENI